MQVEAETETEDQVLEIETGEDQEQVVDNNDQQVETPADEVVVSIGDEKPEDEEDNPGDTNWVRELRKKNREDKRRIKELEDQLRARQEVQPPTLGKKPTLADFEYDDEKFSEALEQWQLRKFQADDRQRQIEQQQVEQQKAWQDKLQTYTKARSELKVSDYEDAEALAQESFNITQQGVILQGADNPALLIYALGKNPKKLKELSDINDPVKFAFAIAKLETQLKVTNRKAPPPPEKVIQGTGRVSGSVDSTLERLREEANKTGDMTKVMEYKRKQKKA